MTRFLMGGIFAPHFHLLFNFKSLSTMGRKNLILGNASGKLGDVVFYRDGGEQRFRTRVTPANPKSIAQQSQRSRLGGVTNTFRALKGVLADSFETKAVNQSAFNAFAAVALPTAPYLNKQFVDAGCALPMPMAISRGSLPAVPMVIAESTGDWTAAIDVPGVTTTDTTTVGQLSAALIAARPCAFSNGTKINIVLVNYMPEDGGEIMLYRPEMVYNSLVLDTASTVSLTAAMSRATITVSADKVTFGVEASSGSSALAVFVSKDNAGTGLAVSNSDVVLSKNAETNYENAITEAARIAAAESYGGSELRCVL